ncbi:unnamed protein product, partial [Medioppia subpectinata]
PDERHNYSLAFDQLFNPEGFGTRYGPSTCETRSKWYDGTQRSQCCWWNGNSWPYSTAHVLSSVAAHLRQYTSQNPRVTRDQYYQLLETYAITQYKDNKPYVAECHSPAGDFWVCDSRNHSEHYAHSTFTDNVLHELLGILPQTDNTLIIDPLVPKTWSYFSVENLLYRGNNITVIYDSTGERYGSGKGMRVYVNDHEMVHKDTVQRVVVNITPVDTDHSLRHGSANFAANPYRRGYPRPYASFTDNNPGCVWQAVDGRIFYDYVPSNRWSNWQSGAPSDWLAVDFGRPKAVSSVRLYVYSDVVTGEGHTDCPTKMLVQYYVSDGNKWVDAESQTASPAQCSPNDLNVIAFKAVNTTQIRVVFTRNVAKDYYCGITEMEVWSEWPSVADTYEAEDGVITDAELERSATASGEAYVGRLDNKGSSVELSGVYVNKSGDYKVRVFYANAGAQDSVHGLVVNQLHTMEVKYRPTAAGWGNFDDKTYVDVSVPLLYGNNALQKRIMDCNMDLFENIPFIDIPDKHIEDVYYYRWSSLKRHLRYLTVGTGYMITEFVHDVGYSAKFGVINAAGGHHIYEARWLRDTSLVKDYINVYARQLDSQGNHQYTEWIADAAYNAYLVNGDKDFIVSQLASFRRTYDLWADHFEPSLGLYYISPQRDAQEYSAASVQTKDKYGGGVGYRPSHNSEMYGNAVAIARMSALAGDRDSEREFNDKALKLRAAIIDHLWDPNRQFFYHMQRENNTNHTLLDTREEVGLYPWRFSVPDERHNYSLAFDQLFNPEGFGTRYGPSTCETRSKWYD